MDEQLLLTLAKVLNVKDVVAFVKAYVSEPFLWRELFPAKKQSSKKLEFIKGVNNLPIQLTQSDSNVASVPIGFDGFSDYSDVLPGYKNNVPLDPEFANRLAVALAMKNKAEKERVLTDIMKKYAILYNNAMVTCENMMIQLITTGVITLPSGRVMDYMFNTNQKETLIGSNAWTDTANSKPLNDIERWRTSMDVNAARAVTSKAAFANLCQNTQIMNEFKNTSNRGYINGEDVKDYILNKFKLDLIVHDKRWKQTGSSTYIFNTQHFVMFGTEELGEMRFATTDSEMFLKNDPDFALMDSDEAIAFVTETKKDPAGHKVIIDMLAAPSGENLNDLFVGKVG